LSVLDPEISLQLRDDLPAEVFAAIVATYEADAARLLDALEAAVAAGDAVAFHRGAHTLAGAAGAVGARDLAATARRGMQAATAEDRALLLPLLRVQARTARAALRALAEGTAGDAR
jgi:HPt (histidine-containing phosphotransfer) domain-containing protein